MTSEGVTPPTRTIYTIKLIKEDAIVLDTILDIVSIVFNIGVIVYILKNK